MKEIVGCKSHSDAVLTSSCLLISSPRHNPNSARVMNMVEDEYDLYLFWDLHDTVLAPFKSELVVYIRREVE